MAKPKRVSFAAADPLVVVADRFDGSTAGRGAIALLSWAVGLARRRALGPITAIVWERGPSAWMVPDGVRVREVESINRWLMPRELVRFRSTRPAGRALRQGRVRVWWALAGESPSVVRLGGRRPEMANYLPPTDRQPVGSEILSEELVASLWKRLLRDRFGVPDAGRLVAGFGAPTPHQGVDQFIAAAAEGDPRDHYLWFLPHGTGAPPESLHDARALGVDDRLHWMPAAGRPADPVVGCDAVVSARRSDGPTLVAELPVVAYDTPSVPATAARPEQLAAAVALTEPDLAGSSNEELAELIGWPARP